MLLQHKSFSEANWVLSVQVYVAASSNIPGLLSYNIVLPLYHDIKSRKLGIISINYSEFWYLHSLFFDTFFVVIDTQIGIRGHIYRALF